MLNLGLRKAKKPLKLKTENHKREMYLQKCNEILSVGSLCVLRQIICRCFFIKEIFN